MTSIFSKTPSQPVPKGMLQTYEAVVALTDAFCAEHLNTEYRDLARRMAVALCRKRPSPLTSGQPRTSASAIIHVLGQLNFLSDPSFEPVMTTSQVAAGFGVGQSTVFATAKMISAALGTHRMDPQWTLRSLVDSNPLTWMAQVNGLLVDLRTMPREVQQIAFDKGMIPYSPADKKSDQLSYRGEAALHAVSCDLVAWIGWLVAAAG
jgi:hypothetical protein